MARVLNKPSSWKPQVNVNTKRMRQLMKDVRTDVVSRTRNSKDLDTWMQKLAPYVASNCFVTGTHASAMQEMITKITGVVDQTSLPRGSNAEMVKGTMAEACMTMVTKVGEDIKTELRKIAVEAYNNKLAPRDTAKLIGEKIDSFSRARCQAIARTETCRAANLANHLNASEMGAKSYSVICNEGACEYCIAEYGENQDTVYAIDDTDNLPPYHTNCRCTPIYSMEEPPASETNEEPVEEPTPQQTPSIPTTEEARNNLTPTEYQEWKLLNEMWEHGQKFKDSDMPGRVKYALDELERVNNNPRWHELNNKALGKLPKIIKEKVKNVGSKIRQTDKNKETPIYNRLKQELPNDFSDNTIDYIVTKIKKRGTKKQEYGEIFDYTSGKSTSPEFKGSNNSVIIKPKDWVKDPKKFTLEELEDAIKYPDKYKKSYVENSNTLATQHNHPDSGSKCFSGADVKSTANNKWEDYGLAISKDELWICERKGSLNIIDANTIESDMDALWVSAKRKTKYELKNNYNGLKGLEKERKRKELLNEHYSLSVLLYFEENTQYGVKVTKIKYDDII